MFERYDKRLVRSIWRLLMNSSCLSGSSRDARIAPNKRTIRGCSLHPSETHIFCVCEHHEVSWCDYSQGWQRGPKWLKGSESFVLPSRCCLNCRTFRLIPPSYTSIAVGNAMRNDYLKLLICGRVPDLLICKSMMFSCSFPFHILHYYRGLARKTSRIVLEQITSGSISIDHADIAPYRNAQPLPACSSNDSFDSQFLHTRLLRLHEKFD